MPCREAEFLDLLARGAPIAASAALIVAHPDDETIGAGASLGQFDDLLLIHVTDGAPRSLHNAREAGFATAAEYAAARTAELHAALRAAEARARTVSLGVPDQEASLRLPQIATALHDLLAGIALVITHAYEGGHPDHDACASAVHRACRGLAAPPVFLEFPCYHAGPDRGWVRQRFLPGPPAATARVMDAAAVTRKRAALDCFASQRRTLAAFSPDIESFRPAPAYDFAAPPHPGPLLYEQYAWGMTGARWRALHVGLR